MFIIQKPKPDIDKNRVVIKLSKEQLESKPIRPREQKPEIQDIVPKENKLCEHMFEVY